MKKFRNIKNSLNNKTKILVVSFVFLALFSGTMIWVAHGTTKAVSVIKIEAGSEMPPPSVFAVNADHTAEYITDVSNLTLNTNVDIELSVMINNTEFDVILSVIDTTPPTASTIYKVIALGENPLASEFVIDIIDATSVSATFYEYVDFSVSGKQEIKIQLKDEGGNVTVQDTNVYIFGILDYLILEAGSDITEISARDFVEKKECLSGKYNEILVSFESDIDRVNTATVGKYEVSILLSETIFISAVVVVDTTSPIAEMQDVELWLNQVAEAEDFILQAHDYSDFTARFKSSPNFDITGTQEIIIVLEDIWGNSAEYISNLTITRDTTPPEIIGAGNITAYVGGSLTFRRNVSAVDNADGDIDFQVDSSAVDVHQAGRYPVIYSAVDSSGNRRSITIYVTIVEPTPVTADSLADDILRNIINESYGQRERALAIHTWVSRNLRLAGSSARDRTSAAISGFLHRQGDCFAFKSVSSVLLDRAGVSNTTIRRVPGVRPTNHWWNLVNIDGVWYHFDASPNRIPNFNGFLFTEADVARINEEFNNYYFHGRDTVP